MLKLIEQIQAHPIMEGYIKDGLPINFAWKERLADITPREALVNFFEFHADLDGVKAVTQYILVAPFTNSTGIEQVSVWQRQLTSKNFTGDDENIPFSHSNEELDYAVNLLTNGQGDPWVKDGITIEWELDATETNELNAGTFDPTESATTRRSWSGEFKQYVDVLGAGDNRKVGAPQVAGDPHKSSETSDKTTDKSSTAKPVVSKNDSNVFTVRDLISTLNKVGSTGKLDSETKVVVILSDGKAETELGIDLETPLVLDEDGSRLILRVIPAA